MNTQIEQLRDVIRDHEASYGVAPLTAYALVDTYTQIVTAPPVGEVRRALRSDASVTLPTETDDASDGAEHTMTLSAAVFELFFDQLGDLLLEQLEQGH